MARSIAPNPARSELAAAAEENEQLKSIISDLKAKAVEKEHEIVGLMTCRAALRIRAMEASTVETEDRKLTLNYAIHLIEALKTELDDRDGGDPWSIDIDGALSKSA